MLPTRFAFSSMRLPTSYWSCLSAMHFEPPIWPWRSLRQYESSSLKSRLVSSAPLAISGFTSLQAGPDAISLWRSGKTLTILHRLDPANRAAVALSSPSSNSATALKQKYFRKTDFFAPHDNPNRRFLVDLVQTPTLASLN